MISGAGEKELTRFRREHVGFVFQFYNLIPSLTALENVSLVTEIADRPLDPEEALRLVGLSARLQHFPAQLSGGEQQRVAIARAIAMHLPARASLYNASAQMQLLVHWKLSGLLLISHRFLHSRFG